LATCKENRALQALKDAFPGGTAQEDTENVDPSGESVSLIIPDMNFRAAEFGCMAGGKTMADCKGEGGDYKCFADAVTTRETIQSIATQMVKIGANSEGSFPVQMQIIGHFWWNEKAGIDLDPEGEDAANIKCRADVVTALIMKEAGDIFASMPQTGAVEFDAAKFMCSAAFPKYGNEAKTTAKVGTDACGGAPSTADSCKVTSDADECIHLTHYEKNIAVDANCCAYCKVGETAALDYGKRPCMGKLSGVADCDKCKFQPSDFCSKKCTMDEQM